MIVIGLRVYLALKTSDSSNTTGNGGATQRNQNAPATSPAPTPTREALVLEHECFTPCKANIQWRFKIIWGDNPLRITYPGGQIVDRHGQDEDFQAPSNMRSGDVQFASLDPEHQHFRVQVYRVE